MRRKAEAEAKADRRAETDGRDVTEQSDPVARIQRAVGNQGLQRQAETKEGLPGLRVEPPDSPSEREAERVAEAVMRDVERSDRTTAGNEDSAGEPSPATGPVDVERSARANGRANTGGEGTNTGGDRTSEDADDLAERIERRTGSGRSLPASERSVFEHRFGRDFGDVTVHDDAAADDLARSLNADAFTTGSDVFFRRGQYRPGTTEGRSLLAHELTHVVQQDSGVTRKIQRQSGGASSASGQSRSGGTTSPVIQQAKTPATLTGKDWQTPLDMNWAKVTDRQQGDVNVGKGETGVMHGGEATVKGPDDDEAVAPDDVQQFEQGDCWLMATLMAVADTDPDLIERMIDRQSDGSYEVTFYKRDGRFAPPGSGNSKVTVTVKPSYIMGAMPQKEEAKVNGGKPETWVMIIEKAYAIAELGREPESSEMANEARQGEDPTGSDLERHERLYERLNEGANEKKMRRVQTAITGNDWTMLDPAGTDPEIILLTVKAAIDHDQPVTAAVHQRVPHSALGGISKKDVEEGPLYVYQWMKKQAGYETEPVRADAGHVYWVKDATENDGFRFVDPRFKRGALWVAPSDLADWNMEFFVGKDAS